MHVAGKKLDNMSEIFVLGVDMFKFPHKYDLGSGMVPKKIEDIKVDQAEMMQYHDNLKAITLGEPVGRRRARVVRRLLPRPMTNPASGTFSCLGWFARPLVCAPLTNKINKPQNRIKQMNCFLFEIGSFLFEIDCVFLEAFCLKLLAFYK